MSMRSVALIRPTSALALFICATASGQIPEVIVTAQKVEQSANSVGMSITAVSGAALRERGITSVTQLSQLVPGFTVQESAFNSVSFTLRGVGFFNSDLSTPPAVSVYVDEAPLPYPSMTPPAVSVYVDEAPLPYPSMTPLAGFDIERVEVLKGPQGTLFGQNATGGAVNYIAAKPTDTLQLGLDSTYGRFNRARLGGFVSGPINDHLGARLAIQGERGDAWQESVTRPGDRLGRIRTLQGRGTLEWSPNEQFVSRLTLGLSYDNSDTLAGQFLAPVSTVPPLAVPGLFAFPSVTKPRAADWTPVRLDTGAPFPYANDTTHFQATLRNEYELGSDIALTALTAYSHSRIAYGQDPDGTPFHINEVIDDAGRISSFFQELRLAGRGGPVKWLVGANFEHDEVNDAQQNTVGDNDVCHLFQGLDPQAFCDYTLYTGQMRVNTSGVFGRIEYDVAENFTFEAATRYNDDRRTFDNCAMALTDHLARFWNTFRGGAPPPTLVDHCFVMDPANGLRPVDNVHRVLDEHNVSWKGGVDWTAKADLLFYANVSKGYKAGTVPVLGATTVTQYTPVPQESVVAYETGFKAGMLNRRVQLNASAFYYDYKDKQLRGSLLDPTFGLLEALVSIPRSHVVGVEAQLTLLPIERLTIDTAATYVKTRVDEFTGFNALAQFGDQSGTVFPFSPRWQSTTNVDYRFPLSAAANGFLGSSLVYSSKSYAGVGAVDIQRIDAFAVLDLRAGVETERGRYRIWAWGRNVTNRYYWSNVLPYGNTISRYVAQPATYGLSLSARF
jgi:iron complex outermembrane recepter protein